MLLGLSLNGRTTTTIESGRDMRVSAAIEWQEEHGCETYQPPFAFGQSCSVVEGLHYHQPNQSPFAHYRQSSIDCPLKIKKKYGYGKEIFPYKQPRNITSFRIEEDLREPWIKNYGRFFHFKDYCWSGPQALTPNNLKRINLKYLLIWVNKFLKISNCFTIRVGKSVLIR